MQGLERLPTKHVMMSKTPERFLWAADLLNVEPGHRILEIGCGAGLLAEQICSRLSDGAFKAIDKSAQLVEKARKRNKVFIEAGKASFEVAEFKNVSLPDFHFDRIIAFNVNFFWQNGAVEPGKIRPALKPTGKLLVFYQAPFEISIHSAEPIRQILVKNSYAILGTVIKPFNPTPAICVTAGPGLTVRQHKLTT